MAETPGRFNKPYKIWWLPTVNLTDLVGVAIFFLVWTAGHFAIGTYLPSPVAVIGDAAQNLFASEYFVGIGLPEGGYLPHLISTTRTALIGCVIGGAIGVVSGLFSAHSRVCFQISRPIAAILGTIPILVAAPFFLIWFGVSDLAKIVLVVFYSATVLHVYTLRGVEVLPPHYSDYARTLGAGPSMIFREISFPGTIPQIFAGMRNALGAAWGLAAITELLGTRYGLGRVISTTWSVQDIKTMMGGLFLLSLIAVVVDGVLMIIRRRATRWASDNSN